MSNIASLSAVLPSEVTLKTVQFELLHPEQSGEESYVNLVLEDAGVLNGTFDGYCIDGDRPIDFEIDWNFNGQIEADEVGQSYSAKVYSSYEPLPDELIAEGVIEKPENLDLLNWIINQSFAGQTSASGDVFTFADVQRAIWSLIDDAPPTDGGFTGPDGYSWTQAKVDEIVAAAQANGEGFVPEFGQKMGVILVPDDASQAGTLDTQIMFAAVELSKLGDKVFHDINADGIQDEGESGIQGVTVNLLADLDGDGVIEEGEVVDTTTTDANGNYDFTVIGGDYKVQFETPDDYTASAANQGSDDSVDSDSTLSDVVTLNPGEYDSTIDSGFFKTAGLGDRVFSDANQNGIQDEGEAGVGGVDVQLLNANGEVVQTTTTTDQGAYAFTDLMPGEYQVKFLSPDGYVFTTANAGDDALDSDADANTGLTQTVTLTSGEFNGTLDAGLVELASIGDRVWEDTNRNGIQDEGETGVAGVKVRLHSPNLANTFEVTTDAEGNYKFEDLMPGDYQVEIVTETLPDGYELTTHNQGNDTHDSDANPTDGFMATTTLSAGEHDMSHDAGIVQKLGQIGDRVWLDNNGNGVQDSGETGINGVTVKLVDASGTLVDSQQTTGDGNYLFDDVAQGNYTVMVDASTLPSDLQQTGDPDTALDNQSSVSLAAGATNLLQDFGYEVATPGIDIEKFTNGVDADTADAAAKIAAGDTVNWTYEVTNTGNVTFDINDVTVTDDQEGHITNIIDQGNGDGLLSPGETWVYQKTGVAQTLTSNTAPQDLQFVFNGNSALDGTNGNVRTFSTGGVSVDVSAFRRTSSGYWDNAYLGAYSGGLGITNRGEGTSAHRVDNRGSVEYLLFEFDQDVTVDKAFLKYVNCDSDISIWIGDRNGADISNLNDSHLNSFAKENNFTNYHYDRWADINSSELEGDTVIISAYTGHTNDAFKLQKLNVTVPGESTSDIYKNVGTVTAGSVSDSDASHYVNPSKPTGEIIGHDCIHEGESESYKVKLDSVVTEDTYVTINIDNGTAQQANGYPVETIKSLSNPYTYNVSMGEQGQLYTANSYDRYYASYYWNGTQWFSGDLNQLPVGANNLTDDFEVAGAQGDQIVVKIEAGSDTSESFEISALKEIQLGKMFSGQKSTEGTEHFSLNIEQIGDYEVSLGEKQIAIKDNYANYSPISFDLNGDGIQTLSIDQGVKFDMLVTGTAVNTGWLSGEDGFLAVDNNGDGVISDRSELFGGGVGDGFAKLSTFDSNGDGLVNASDTQFDELKLWQDANENGLTDKGELMSLESAGISDLNTAYQNVFRTDAHGNIHGEVSSAIQQGHAIEMTDVYFQVAV